MGNDISATPCALVVMGVSGSGKSTIGEKLAQRLGWSYEDGDRFHPSSNVAKMSAGQPLTDEDRWPWLQAIANEIDRVCEAGEHAVIACSALKRAYRDIIVGPRLDVALLYLRGARELIAARMAARHGHFMPAALLASQLRTLECPGDDEADVLRFDIASPASEIVRRAALALGGEVLPSPEERIPR